MSSTPLSILEALLKSADLSFNSIEEEEVAGQRVLHIKVDDGKTLIGMRGDTIRSIDYLVKKMAEQAGLEERHFLVDVNGYRIKQIEDIQNKARMMAERARSFEYDVELNPMSAYERLIVHHTLQEEKGISTESHGEGRNRRVVIRFVS